MRILKGKMNYILVSVLLLPLSVCFLDQPSKSALTSPESTPSAWRPGVTSAKPTSRVLYHSVTMYIHEGLTTILSCNVVHNKIPKWTDPRGRIVNFNDYSFLNPTFPYQDRFSVSQEGYLVIRYTKPYDAGQYTCSYPGHGSETTGLVVTPPITTHPTASPSLLSTPRATNTIVKISITLYIHQGQKTILSCSATNKIPMWADPYGRIINFPDSSFLNPTYPYQNRVSVSLNGYMVINNTQWSDAGKYVCSYPGHGHQTVTLVVRPPLVTDSVISSSTSSTMILPTGTTNVMIWHISVTLYVHEGQTITLSCSTPNIIPMWTDPRRRIINFNDSTSLNPTFPHSSRFSIDKDGHLVINDIRPSDAGKYLCSYPGYEDETVTVIVGPSLSTSTTGLLSNTVTSFSSSTLPSKATMKSNLVSATTPPQLTSYTRAATVSNASVLTSPRITTKSPATIPPVSTICAVCAGPVEACEVAFYEEACKPPNHYCINHITNKADGQKLVERKCGNVTTCYNEWYLGTSDDDKCRALSSSSSLNYMFECTFCCVKDGCNVDLHPKADTLYTNT